MRSFVLSSMSGCASLVRADHSCRDTDVRASLPGPEYLMQMTIVVGARGGSLMWAVTGMSTLPLGAWLIADLAAGMRIFRRPVC